MARSKDLTVLKPLGILLIGLAIGIAGMAYLRTGKVLGTDPKNRVSRGESPPVNPLKSGLPPRESIVAMGTLEPQEGIVQISSALVGYQIKEILVTDGQNVMSGQVLIELEAAPATAEHELALSRLAEAKERQLAEIELAKQRVSAAELSAQQAADGRALELAAQTSRVTVVAAKQKQAERDLERFKELQGLADPLASEQQVEQQQLLLDATSAEREAAESALKRLEQSLTFQEQTVRAELRAAQQSLALAEKGTGLESLGRQVELAELKLNQTQIKAPSAGQILSVLAHTGEVVPQQPLLQMANLEKLVCIAEVDAGDVAYLQPNQNALVRCRAFHGAELEGTIDRVGNQAAQAGLRPVDPRQPVDRDVSRVVVPIDARQAARLLNLAGGDQRVTLVGLRVDVVFPLKKSAAVPRE